MNKLSKDVLNLMMEENGFNRMTPRDIAAELTREQKHWVNVFWSPNQIDTVYVIPKSTSLARARCQLVGWKTRADEIHSITPKDVRREIVDYDWRGNLTEEEREILNTMLKGVRKVLRLWWD